MAKRLKHKDINFLQVLHERPEGQQGPGKKRALIALPIVLAVAVALAYGGMAFRLYQQGAALSAASSYLDDPQNLLSQQQSRQWLAKSQAVQAELRRLDDTRDALATLPVFDTGAFAHLYAAASGGVTILQMEYTEDAGVLTVSAQSASVTDAPVFVQRLRGTGLFSDISYTGYLSDTDGMYYFSASCLRKGGDAS